MLAVVIILVIVAGIGFVVVNNQIERSRENTDAANIRTVADAVQRFIMDNSEAPENVTELVTEGYLAAAPQDPWGDQQHNNPNAYITITPQGRNVVITSAHGHTVTLQNALPQQQQTTP
jgi:general secretion pathway protein G